MHKGKMSNTILDVDLLKEIKILAAQLDLRQNDLLEEAAQDLIKKYKDKDRPKLSFSERFLLRTLQKDNKQNIH